MLDPVSFGVAAFLGNQIGTAFSGIIGNAADRIFVEKSRDIRNALLAGLAQPRNHDLARAIRRSQLLALRLTVRAYEKLPQQDFRARSRNTAPGFTADDIKAPLDTWINQAVVGEATLTPAPSALSEEDLRRRQTQIAEIEAKIERVYTHPEPGEGSAQARLSELRKLCEDWMIEEARAKIECQGDWLRFETLLRSGDSGFPGWWPMFRAYMAEEVKDDPRVNAILLQQNIAKILGTQEDLQTAVAALQTGLDTFLAEGREALRLLRAATEDIQQSAALVAQALALFDGRADQLLEVLRQVEKSAAELVETFLVPIDSGTVDPESVRPRILARPTELLISRYGIIPYMDRGGTLDNLVMWATDPSQPCPKGRLYEAAGGFGKTRMAIEAIKRLGPGWISSFLTVTNTRNLPPGAFARLVNVPEALGVFIVIDYAEGQVDILRQLAAAAAKSDKRVRILALARSSHGWWEGVRAEDDVGDVFEFQPYAELTTPLAAPEREQLFDTAKQGFLGAFRQFSLPDTARDGGGFDLGTAAFDRPLGVAFAAYLAVSGANVQAESLFSAMAAQEKRHWKRALGHYLNRTTIHDNDPVLLAFSRLMAQVTLVQGATLAGARTLMAADPKAQALSVETRDSIVAAAEIVFGVDFVSPSDDETDRVAALRQIEPDLLGEHLAMEHMDDGALGAATFQAILDGHDLYGSDLGSFLTVLVRATRDEHDRQTKDGAKRALQALATIAPSLSLEQAHHVAGALVEYSLPLARLSVAIAKVIVDTCTENEELAGALNNYAVRLGDIGETREALNAARRAVEIYENLTKCDPSRFQNDLAMALNNYANHLGEIGEVREALAPARRAVEIREILSEAEPTLFLPALALALNNYANRLSEVGEVREALAPARRAVEIRENLAKAEPARFLPALALALNNYANRLSDVGEVHEALRHARRAVEIRENLAKAEPARFLPDLAMALSNYANCLGDVGETREALDHAKRAVEIQDNLAGHDPARFLPDLALALSNYALRLTGAGEARAALEPARRAAEIGENLAQAEPAPFLPVLAKRYGTLGHMFNGLAQPKEASAAFEKGIHAIKSHAADLPQAYLGLLHALLRDFVRALHACDMPEAEIIERLVALELDPSLLPSESPEPPPSP